MKRESVIIKTFTISRPKQVELFQVRIPREAESIMGVEIGGQWLNGILPTNTPNHPWTLPMQQKRNLVLGEVKLQSYEKANVFYAGELVLNNNSDYANFASEYFTPKVYSHHYQSHEEALNVSGTSTLVQGVYRDKLSDNFTGTYQYTVNVYVWIAAKETPLT